MLAKTVVDLLEVGGLIAAILIFGFVFSRVMDWLEK